MRRTKKIILLGMMVSMALVLHIFEGFIPLSGVMPPGAKLGLANIITVIAIIAFGFKEAVLVVVLRTFLGSLFGGGFMVFFYSLAGGLLSTAVMSILYKKFNRHFSLTGISIAGGVFHNIGQLLVFSIVVNTAGIFAYLPILLIAGVATGYFIGLAASFLERYIKNHMQWLMK